MRGHPFPCAVVAILLVACAGGRPDPPPRVETEGVSWWIDGADPTTKKVRIRNDSDRELRVVAVEFLDDTFNIEHDDTLPLDLWLRPGQEDSVEVRVREVGVSAKLDVKIRWEMVTRTTIEKKGELGPPRPRLGPLSEPDTLREQ